MSAFWKLFDGLLNLMAGLAGVILVFITAAVCYTIGMRYLFTQTTIWLMQTTEYALLWIVFLATTWLLREGGHITTDIVYGHLKTHTKRRLDIVLFACAAVVCAVCLYFAGTYTLRCMAENITDVRGITVPKAAIFVIIPIGFLMLTIQFGRMLTDRIKSIRAER